MKIVERKTTRTNPIIQNYFAVFIWEEKKATKFFFFKDGECQFKNIVV